VRGAEGDFGPYRERPMWTKRLLFEAGLDALLVKPTDRDALVKMLDRWCEDVRKRRVAQCDSRSLSGSSAVVHPSRHLAVDVMRH
jgi:hypothetical protein